MRLVLGGKSVVPLNRLLVFSFILTVITLWGYGNSYAVYAAVSIGMMIYAYGKFGNKVIHQCTKIEVVVLAMVFIGMLTGFMNGSLKSAAMVNTSLIMPFVLSFINIDYQNDGRHTNKASVVILFISILLMSGALVWNSNSLGILLYCGVSVGFLWFICSDSGISKVFAMIYLIIAAGLIFVTESRNAALVIVVCIGLLLFYERLATNKFWYRIIYLAAMMMTVFAIPFMDYVFDNRTIMNFITDFTSQVSSKTYGMSGHLTILLYVKEAFAELDIVSQLFGQGIKSHHCHNLFYQCLFFYGYIGTALIYFFFVYIFENGYKLYVRYNDKLAISCCIVLIGHFFMQCAETYMLGLETTMMICSIPVAIILNKKRQYRV